MKVQEVILRALAKKITWWQAAEIIGISDRSMRRWHERLEEFGYDGLLDRRRGQPSPKRVPLATVEQVLGLIECDPLSPVRHEKAVPHFIEPQDRNHRTFGGKACEDAEAILPTGLIFQKPLERQRRVQHQITHRR